MSFSLDLSKFSKLTENKMEKVVKKVFIGLSADIIKDTPVLSGRARMNWFPAINKYSDTSTDSIDKVGVTAINRATSKANQYRLGDTITLSNNLPYAMRLEYGWSKKAPAGMVRLNVARFQQWVDKEARKAR